MEISEEGQQLGLVTYFLLISLVLVSLCSGEGHFADWKYWQYLELERVLDVQMGNLKLYFESMGSYGRFPSSGGHSQSPEFRW